MQLIDSPKERAKRSRTPIDKSVAPRSKAKFPECPSAFIHDHFFRMVDILKNGAINECFFVLHLVDDFEQLSIERLFLARFNDKSQKPTSIGTG